MSTQPSINDLQTITRKGAYAVAVHKGCILLIKKTSGCYKDLLDLPGGGIEENESPDEALQREFLEEVGMKFDSHLFIKKLITHIKILNVDAPFYFHHIGDIFEVSGHQEITNSIPEEAFAWYPFKELNLDKLTPFARDAVKNLNNKSQKTYII